MIGLDHLKDSVEQRLVVRQNAGEKALRIRLRFDIERLCQRRTEARKDSRLRGVPAIEVLDLAFERHDGGRRRDDLQRSDVTEVAAQALDEGLVVPVERAQPLLQEMQFVLNEQ